MDPDLKLIQECGFNSFEEVEKRINIIVNIMRVCREKVEKNLQRFDDKAKELVKKGLIDKAKRELMMKKRKEERIKAFNSYFNVILEKVEEVSNSNEMLKVLNATKYCINVLLEELQEIKAEETKEYQDLVESGKDIIKYLKVIIKAKKPEKDNDNDQELDFPDLDFNNLSQFLNLDEELQLIKQCGFNSLKDALNKIIYFLEKIKLGKIKVEKNLERYTNKAKEHLRVGQKDDAKKELTIKKQKEGGIKILDNYFNEIIEKIKEVKNTNHMLQILNATKFCNNIILSELDKNEIGEETKEYFDLVENDKEINKYIQTINSFYNNMENQNNQGDINPGEESNNNPGQESNNNPGQESNNNDDNMFPSDSI